MNNKICVFRQPAGLGDIFFLQKAAYEFHMRGYHIVWPVIDNFLYIEQHIRTPYITFYSEEENFPFKEIYMSNPYNIIDNDDFLYIPFQHADRICSHASLMEVKYKLVNIDSSDWVNYFNFKRNTIRENFLYHDVLNIQENEEYILVNKNYGSPPNFKTLTNIKYPTNTKVVEMDFYGLDTIFDWCKVVENAKEIYTVETAICYIMDKLKTENVNLYPRDGLNLDYAKLVHSNNNKYTYINNN